MCVTKFDNPPSDIPKRATAKFKTLEYTQTTMREAAAAGPPMGTMYALCSKPEPAAAQGATAGESTAGRTEQGLGR